MNDALKLWQNICLTRILWEIMGRFSHGVRWLSLCRSLSLGGGTHACQGGGMRRMGGVTVLLQLYITYEAGERENVQKVQAHGYCWRAIYDLFECLTTFCWHPSCKLLWFESFFKVQNIKLMTRGSDVHFKNESEQQYLATRLSIETEQQNLVTKLSNKIEHWDRATKASNNI